MVDKKELDNISRLFLLQASSKNSVVSEDKLSQLQKNLYIKTKLDDYLFKYCKESYNKSKTKLIILSGNAGDGKSMMLNQLKRKFHNINIPEEFFVYNADATHTDKKDQKLENKLSEFFINFKNDFKHNTPKIYLIAMNIGIAIRYFNSEEYKELIINNRKFYNNLKSFVFNELNIKTANSSVRNSKLAKNLLVVNFDLRCIVKPNLKFIDNNKVSFFKKMVDKIYTLVDLKYCNKDNCIKDNCPIYMNLKLIKNSHIRNKIENILYKVFLYNKVHLTPRNIWDFIYFIITGGENKYLELSNKQNFINNPCNIIKQNIDNENFNEFLFFNNLFDNNSENAILKFIQNEIKQFDPVYINHRKLEIDKILLSSNPELLNNGILDSHIELDNFDDLKKDIILDNSLKNNLNKLIKNVSRFSYFVNKNYSDILLQTDTLFNNKENFQHFYDTLQIQKKNNLEEHVDNVDMILRKKISNILVATFGNKDMSDHEIMQIDTVKTRSRGKLLARLVIKVGNKLHRDFSPINKRILKVVDYFPNYFIVKINDMNLKVTLDLYELFNLADSGYNISSVDLERFKQLEILNNKILPNLEKDDSVFYEHNNTLSVFQKTAYEVEFKNVK